jgi:MoxR-like ATPase
MGAELMAAAAPLQRPPAELLFAAELAKLAAWDRGPVPPGWRLSPPALERFILGDDELGIARKLVVPRALVTRVIIALATNRGAMLVGVPGTAKSWFSELLACGISGDSTLTVQGGAIGNIQQLLYGWNEAVLRQRGPCPEALVPGPVYRGMQQGRIVRFEEIARCSTEVQDGILSILSERQILVPELEGADRVLFARAGFNLIGTSNTLDQGVREMSAALKRRMNFETIEPIAELGDEIEVVIREATQALRGSGVAARIAPDIVEVLVTIFHELRNGQTIDGRSTDRLAAAVMSTAEAVSVVHAMGIHAYYYRDGNMHAEDLVHFLVGASLKDNREDRRRLRHYFDTEVALRKASVWQVVYAHRELL